MIIKLKDSNIGDCLLIDNRTCFRIYNKNKSVITVLFIDDYSTENLQNGDREVFFEKSFCLGMIKRKN